jgi:hypothetical protein
MLLRGKWPLLLLGISPLLLQAQIDPEKRRLAQFGFNQPIEGRSPISGYGFYYLNQPHFFHTNLTLRLAIAPVYVDGELGYSGLLGPNTDLAVGVAGGAFADSFSEIRRGKYLEEESFLGHGGEVSLSLYHRFNPEATVPLWLVLRAAAHQSYYTEDDTAKGFELPEDRAELRLRTGFRLGGQEPSMTEPLALELSVWHEAQFRDKSGSYGFANDRNVEASSHLFWARALMKYTFDESEQLIEASVTAGTSIHADRFSAYRLGGVLPFASEFPLNIPGYYFQELTARRFMLLNVQYSFPIEPSKNWRVSTFAATGPIDYLEPLAQPGHWHSGVGGGITYISPAGAWLATLIFSHGFDAMRSHGRGANQIGLLLQYDFEAKRRGKSRWFVPGASPYRSRGGERILRDRLF